MKNFPSENPLLNHELTELLLENTNKLFNTMERFDIAPNSTLENLLNEYG